MDSGTTSSNAITSKNFDEFNANLQSSALKATRNALSIPEDIGFHRSVDHALAQDLDTFASRVLTLTNKILTFVETNEAANGKSKGKGKSYLETQDDVTDHFRSRVVDSMDQLLERTDISLDTYLGRIKAPSIAINTATIENAPISKKRKVNAPKSHLDPSLQNASHIPKPQLSFKRKPDNSDTPWFPQLSHKYNAVVPLGHVYDDPAEVEVNDRPISAHPYHYEITHLSYPPSMFTSCTPIPPPPIEETPFTWVNTPTAFQKMITKLQSAREIAVDLEHHSYRSYAGFLCLMQVSDREEDWVVDLLVLREEMKDINEVFTDPTIVKVFHGAESDVLWLQQDFNVYIVNLFDTFHASKLLEFPRHGLANLLEMYCDFTADKRYQLADWRIRPLPNEMEQYARSDTHFLLFIYDNLRNALLDRGSSKSGPPSPSSSSIPSVSQPANSLLHQALARSAETSLRVYVKELYDFHEGSGANGWDTLAKKWNKGVLMAGELSIGVMSMQREVYRSVHWWRERVAREEDESVRYVLPNHFLFQLAEKPPADMATLLGIFRGSIPPIVRKRSKDLLEAVREAVKVALSKTTTESALEKPLDVVEMKDIGDLNQPEQNTNMSTQGQTELQAFWGRTDSKLLSSIATSSLFGPKIPNRNFKASFSAPRSTLFGDIIQPLSSGLDKHTSDDSLFKTLVARINSTLVIVPTVPRASATVQSTTLENMDQANTDGAQGMQVEIPYVPVAQRQTIQAREQKDTIVVVGQAKQKKRKRIKGAAEDLKHNTQIDDGNETKEESQPFDFSAVPNMLDGNPDIEDGNRRKKKQKKKGGTFFGDFPAPPKAHSELKSGNQSHTFK